MMTKWHFRNSEFYNFLGGTCPWTPVEFLASSATPIQKSFPRACTVMTVKNLRTPVLKSQETGNVDKVILKGKQGQL